MLRLTTEGVNKMAEPKKPTLADLYPDMVKDGQFALPTTAELNAPNRTSSDGNVEVSWYEDPAVAAASTALGATAGAVAGKYVTPNTADVKAERNLAGLNAQFNTVGSQLETARAPLRAAQDATTSAQMEFARNRMLMDAATKRAMELGVDPRQFVKSPELFIRAMSPQAGYGSTNWFKSEYGNVNPILEDKLVGKGGAKEAVANYLATEPKAQQVVGGTVQQKSGIITPMGTGREATRAGLTVGNIDKNLIEAMQAVERMKEAEAAVPRSDTGLESRANTLEQQIAGQKAEMARAAQMSPSALDKLAKTLSGPFVGAGLGALSAYQLPKAVREAMAGDYKNAILHGMEGLGGAAMAFPHPLVKAAGLAATAIPLGYEYLPKGYDLIRGMFPATPKK
jgi:hypothetical protein